VEWRRLFWALFNSKRKGKIRKKRRKEMEKKREKKRKKKRVLFDPETRVSKRVAYEKNQKNTPAVYSSSYKQATSRTHRHNLIRLYPLAGIVSLPHASCNINFHAARYL